MITPQRERGSDNGDYIDFMVQFVRVTLSAEDPLV